MALHKKVIFDNIHGYITLNRVEERILQTAYYQRLRWIKQLGFTFYLFPGATHTRFAHTLGVLHVMDKILKGIGKAAPEEKFFDPEARDKETTFHRTMRLAGMLHDIGTFPFSHTVEISYLEHWKKQTGTKRIESSHENMGSHILQNTDFEGGLTRILKEEGIDPKELSQIISGKSNNNLANQLMHSDMDADRMDYLIRDSYHTGVKYGEFDRDYLIQNLKSVKYKGQEVLAIEEHAMQVVEYFLICRYSWYSQIIANGTGYKFDLVAAKIYEYFLENGQAHSFKYLMEELTQDPTRFFTFNDSYFMGMLNDYLAQKTKHPVITELCEMLAYRKAPKHITCAPIVPTLIESPEHKQEVVEVTKKAAQWLEAEAKKLDPNSWMIIDIPKKDVTFMSNPAYNGKKELDPMLDRDPVKVITRDGDLKQLVDVPNSVMKVLRGYRNFFPHVYTSPKTYEMLEKKGILKALQEQFKPINKKAS